MQKVVTSNMGEDELGYGQESPERGREIRVQNGSVHRMTGHLPAVNRVRGVI